MRICFSRQGNKNLRPKGGDPTNLARSGAEKFLRLKFWQPAFRRARAPRTGGVTMLQMEFFRRKNSIRKIRKDADFPYSPLFAPAIKPSSRKRWNTMYIMVMGMATSKAPAQNAE